MSDLYASITSFVIGIIFVAVTYLLIKKRKVILNSILGKVLKVLLILISVIIAISSLFAGINYLNEHLHYGRLKVLNGFGKISLGLTEDEVIFRLGKPKFNIAWDKGQKSLFYENGPEVDLINDATTEIFLSCKDYSYDKEMKFGGITCQSSVEDMEKKFGASRFVSSAADKTRRFYSYPEYNIGFELEAARVIGVVIFDSSKLPEGFKFPSEVPKVKNSDSVSNATKAVKQSQPTTELKQDEQHLDHCAPGLSRAERLRRLGLLGPVRETGYETYSTKGHVITFVMDQVGTCY